MSRGFVGVLLLISGLLGLFMTLCGGVFSVAGLGAGGGGYAQGMLVMSVPSLLAGIVVLRMVWRRFVVWRKGVGGGGGHESGRDGPPPP